MKGNRRSGLFTLFLTASLVVCGCGGQEQAQPEEQARQQAVAVKAVTAQTGTLTVSNEFIGTVAPQQQVSVIPMVSGVIDEVYAQVGDEVQAGDVLFHIEDDAARLQKESAELSKNSAEAAAQMQLGSAQVLNNISMESNIRSIEFQIQNAKDQYQATVDGVANAKQAKSDMDSALSKINNSIGELQSQQSNRQKVIQDAQQYINPLTGEWENPYPGEYGKPDQYRYPDDGRASDPAQTEESSSSEETETDTEAEETPADSQEETLPQNAETGPEGETAPQNTETGSKGETAPQNMVTASQGETTPQSTETSPQGETAPQNAETTPQGETTPQNTVAASQGETAPQSTETSPQGETAPQGTETSSEGEPAPQSMETAPQGETAPETEGNRYFSLEIVQEAFPVYLAEGESREELPLHPGGFANESEAWDAYNRQQKINRVKSQVSDMGYSAGDIISGKASQDMLQTAAQIVSLQYQASQIQSSQANMDSSIAQAETSRDAAKKTIDFYEDNLEDAQVTYGIANGQSYQDTAATLANQIAAADVGVRSAQLQLEYYSPTTPISGIVVSRSIEQYGIAQPGYAAYVISNQDAMNITFSVSGQVRENLAVGMPVKLEKDGEQYDGTIIEIGEAVETQTGGLFTVKAVTDVGGDKLVSGSAVKLIVDTFQAENAVLLPYDAVHFESEQAYVFVISDGKAVRTPVEVGLMNEDTVEITGGLTSGVKVVSTWSSQLEDGISVRIIGENQPAESTASGQEDAG